MMQPAKLFSLFLGLLLVVTVCVTPTIAKVAKGHFTITSTKDSKRFDYLSKFCFDTDGIGKMEAKFWSNEPTNKTLVLLYDDEGNKSYDWFDVYKNNKLTCEEKTHRSDPNFAHPSVNGHARNLVVDRTKPNEYLTWEFRDVMRPHFWYVASSQCNEAEFNLNYDIHFINGGSSWNAEFSCEQQGLLTMSIVFFLVWILGAAVQAYSVYGLWRKNCLHLLARLLAAAIAFQAFALMCLMIHFAVYQKDGVGSEGLATFGYILEFFSVMSFMLMLILMSKGWAITRYQFTELKGKRVLVGILVVLFLAYLSMFIWEEVGLDPSLNYWIYETVPGIILLVLRALTMFYFLFNIWFTYRIEDRPDKHRFYIILAVVGASWFASLPLFAGISSALDDWVATKTVSALTLTAQTLFYGFFAVLMWPSLSEKYFEFTPPDAFDAVRGHHYEEL